MLVSYCSMMLSLSQVGGKFDLSFQIQFTTSKIRIWKSN